MPENDKTTYFICSGMQLFKSKFKEQTKEKISTLQSCVRTNDIDLWGDETHFCHFRMIGCFSFGNDDYPQVIDMWLLILKELNLFPEEVHIHPSSDHKKLVEHKGNYKIIEDEECVWSDGEIGGYCTEFYIQGIEIGNLVNTLGHSVDVGFGLERLAKLMGEQYPKTYDLEEFLKKCHEQNLSPGQKGIESVVRKVFRKWFKQPEKSLSLSNLLKDWILVEEKRKKETEKEALKLLKTNRDKSDEWWKSTTGLSKQEVLEYEKENQTNVKVDNTK